MSYQVGLITVGAVILALGFYMKQGGLEGFQAIGTPPSVFSKETLTLESKMNEIGKIYSGIMSNKTKMDATLSTFITPEQEYSLTYLLEDIKTFASDEDKMTKLRALYEKSVQENNTKTVNDIENLVSTVHQQAQILFYFFSTLPSMIISSNILVNSDQATSDSVADEKVVNQMKLSLTQILGGLPKPDDRFRLATNLLKQEVGQYNESNFGNNDFLNKLIAVMEEYQRIAGIMTTISTKQIENAKTRRDAAFAKAGGNPNTGGVNTKDPMIQVATTQLKAAGDNRKELLNGIINTVTMLKTKVDKATELNPTFLGVSGFKTAVDGSLKTYTTMRDNIASDIGELNDLTQPPLIPGATPTATEGFQSYQNPYNQPSPITQQAYEFRLGKRGIVQSILG